MIGLSHFELKVKYTERKNYRSIKAILLSCQMDSSRTVNGTK